MSEGGRVKSSCTGCWLPLLKEEGVRKQVVEDGGGVSEWWKG